MEILGVWTSILEEQVSCPKEVGNGTVQQCTDKFLQAVNSNHAAN